MAFSVQLRKDHLGHLHQGCLRPCKAPSAEHGAGHTQYETQKVPKTCFPKVFPLTPLFHDSHWMDITWNPLRDDFSLARKKGSKRRTSQYQRTAVQEPILYKLKRPRPSWNKRHLPVYCKCCEETAHSNALSASCFLPLTAPTRLQLVAFGLPPVVQFSR